MDGNNGDAVDDNDAAVAEDEDMDYVIPMWRRKLSA